MAAKYDVPILTCDWRGIPIAGTFPWSHNSRVAARHHAQAELSLPRSKNAWMRIVKAKIRGQAGVLRVHSPGNADRLDALAGTVRSGDPHNVEAQAARYYWSHLFPAEGFSRTPGLGQGLNGFLDYGYTILRGYTIRAICVAGLWPTLGMWHHQRSNTFGLADDLMEPFRPAVDTLVKELQVTKAEDGLLDPDAKHQLVQVTSLSMTRGVGDTVATAISTLVQRFAIYIEGDVQSLEVPIWQEPDG